MALPHACGHCGATHPKGQRCRNTTQRGYGATWQTISKQVITEEGCCTDCGHTGSTDNPLTCDHIIPKAHGGTDDRHNLTCRFRKHNSAKGAGRG